MTRFKTFDKDKKQKYPKELHRNPKSQKHPEIIRGFANLGKNRIFVSMHGIARLLHFLVLKILVLCFVLMIEHCVLKLSRTKIIGMPGLQYTQPPD